ncbi:concanavalin A-like lectin/glucanase [Anaeromyces robustus]|uniref:endo-1,4-beta-xylanase n=1 Tax=Anaeromyces robustus TaxID=1754192 RepID=A0A1Y1WQT6_9FUNG|nr:concanavalin A-like lectin/glucanase [Anaeromyces robustus]|eukprot:ORX75636.1 concanavalin A-like lectin/glucanase [Anaeromyces robustus]
MKFSIFPVILSLATSTFAQSFCSASGHSGQSVTERSNKVGSINGIGYELWADSGNNSATFYADGSFSCSFQNAKDYLCRSGLSFDSTKTHQQIGHMYADFKLVKQNIRNVDYSYVGIYGWTRNPLVEFYVVDNWLSQYRPGDWVGNKKHGDYTIDGARYTVYENSRYGPSIDGDTTFKQYFSIRQQARDCGTIDITAHFEQWEKLGMKMGKMHEAKVLGEAGSTGSGTSGTADFPYAKVYIGSGNGNNNSGNNNNSATKTVPKTTTKTVPKTSTKTLPQTTKTLPKTTKSIPQTSTKTVPKTSTKSIPQTSTKTVPKTSTKSIPQTSTKTVPKTSTKSIPQTTKTVTRTTTTRTSTQTNNADYYYSCGAQDWDCKSQKSNECYAALGQCWSQPYSNAVAEQCAAIDRMCQKIWN